MNILALESSATACSAALCRDGELLAQSFQCSGLTHSRTLLPMVNDLLKNCGQTLEQVDVIAVADAGKDVEKKEHSSVVGGIASLYNHSRNQSGGSSENWT